MEPKAILKLQNQADHQDSVGPERTDENIVTQLWKQGPMVTLWGFI